MKIVFELPQNYSEAIAEITTQCVDAYTCEEKQNLSGDQIVAIIVAVTPIVWEIIERYLPDTNVTIKVQLDENATITISERSIKRALKKVEQVQDMWKKQNGDQ